MKNWSTVRDGGKTMKGRKIGLLFKELKKKSLGVFENYFVLQIQFCNQCYLKTDIVN